MWAGDVVSRTHKPPPSTDLNNLSECCFGTRVALHVGESAAHGIRAFRYSGGLMSAILIFTREWVRSYCVLRYGKTLGFVASVRYGLVAGT